MNTEAIRQAIRDLWPAHADHLVPAENRMGQPYIDTEAGGVVCNCGDVLGWPDDAPKPDEVVEHHYDAAADPSAMAGGDNEDAVPMAELPAAAYDGPPRAGDGAIYTDPSGVQWKSTAEHPHPDDPRFKYFGQGSPEPPWDAYEDHGGGPKREPAGEVQGAETFGDLAPELFDQAERFLSGRDSPDEAQATLGRRPVQDVQLPPVTDEQIAAAGTALARGDREGFHDVLNGQLPERPANVVEPVDPLSTPITIIDPTLPYGPEQVEQQLIRIDGQIERGIHFQRYWEERQHYAKIAYELASARALIKATGGDAATRKAQALLACEDEYIALAVADTMVKSVRECMHNLRSLQTGYQTISNSVGSTMRARPYGA